MGEPSKIPDLVPRRAVYPELSTLLERIEAAYRPTDVLLFGSRARGDFGRDSDWDVLVLLPEHADERLLDPLLSWEVQQGSGVHADVLCAYGEEFVRDLHVGNSRTREIVGHAVRIAAG